MNRNMDNTPQPSEQCSEKPTVDIGKLGFVLSLISIPLCFISPTSLVLSCIGASYRRTKQTTAGIIISTVTMLLLLILLFAIWSEFRFYTKEPYRFTEYQDVPRY